MNELARNLLFRVICVNLSLNPGRRFRPRNQTSAVHEKFIRKKEAGFAPGLRVVSRHLGLSDQLQKDKVPCHPIEFPMCDSGLVQRARFPKGAKFLIAVATAFSRRQSFPCPRTV